MVGWKVCRSFLEKRNQVCFNLLTKSERPGQVSKLSMSSHRSKNVNSRGGRQNRPTQKRPKHKANLIGQLIRHVEPKYLDVLSLANNIGAGATLFPLSLVPQGDQQLQRVGDFIQPLKLVFNYSLYTVNSDIVTTVRLFFFRWLPSTALSTPVVANLLESPSSANVLSHFNFQTQDNYRILWEKQYQCSGITVAPTVASNFGGTGVMIPIGKGEIEYTLSATTGTNTIYLLAISDSSVTPFPILNFSARLYFEDTIKKSAPHGMPK